MTKYMMHYEGVGREVHLDMRTLSSEQIGQMQADFAREVLRKRKVGDSLVYADLFRMDSLFTANGLFYAMDLCAAGGLYTLLVTPDLTREDVRKAKEKMRRSYDVVSLRTLKIERLI